TFMMFLSHGTQDLYPDFLKEVHRISAVHVSDIAIAYNIGAVIGAIVFGFVSQAIGRRYGMICALAVSLLAIPLWAFGSGAAALVLGAVVMQIGVQGAWGVIPVHLNEMSADVARGLMPGLAYQLGILIASPTNSIEYALRERLGSYSWALATFELITIASLTVLLLAGTEAHSKPFHRTEPAAVSP